MLLIRCLVKPIKPFVSIFLTADQVPWPKDRPQKLEADKTTCVEILYRVGKITPLKVQEVHQEFNMHLHTVVFTVIAVLRQLLAVVEEYLEGVLNEERMFEVAGKIGMVFYHVAAGLKQLRRIYLESGFLQLMVLLEGLLCNECIGMVRFLLQIRKGAVTLEAFLFATFVIALFGTFELTTRASRSLVNV